MEDRLICLEILKENNEPVFPNLQDLLTENKSKDEEDISYFIYYGSLTKPPCKGNIKIYVLNVARIINRFQLDSLVKFTLDVTKIKTNVRNTQDI